MPSPIALASPRQDSIFNKRPLSYMRSAQPYLTAVSEADARARVCHSARFTSTLPHSLSPSATILFKDAVLNNTPDDNYNGLAYPAVPPISEQDFSTDHLQFGFCPNINYRYTSAHKSGTKLKEVHQQDPPYYILLSTYFSCLLLIFMGHIRDFFGKRLYPASYRHILPFDVSHQSPCVNCLPQVPSLLGPVCCL